MLVRNIVDLFDDYFPGGAFFLDNIRRLRCDVRTLARSLTPWHEMEEQVPALTLELTNICNANCRFCAYQYQSKFRTGRGIMSDELFDKAADEYIRMGGRFVGLTPFSGEPLLDPKLVDRIEKLNKAGAWTGFYTNGILLKHIDIDRLLRSGLNALSVSTGPLKRDMYELLYRNKHYDDVLQGLHKLLVTRNRIQPDYRVHISFRSHLSMREVFKLSDFRKVILPLLTPEDYRNIIVNTRGFDTWGGQIKPADMVGMMRLALPPVIKNRPCSWTWGLYVTWNGQVRACACRYAETENNDGRDELFLGDISKKTLNEIWHGTELRILRRRFLHGNLPVVCKKCTMYRSV